VEPQRLYICPIFYKTRPASIKGKMREDIMSYIHMSHVEIHNMGNLRFYGPAAVTAGKQRVTTYPSLLNPTSQTTRSEESVSPCSTPSSLYLLSLSYYLLKGVFMCPPFYINSTVIVLSTDVTWSLSNILTWLDT
jgi:hypothetical protein